MKRIMKMATVVAGVGAMLSFAGCGEQDAETMKKSQNPLNQAISSFMDANSVMKKAGLPELYPQEIIDEMKSSSSIMSEKDKNEAADMAKRMARSMQNFKKYVALMQKAVSCLTIPDAQEPVKAQLAVKAMEFFEKTSEQQEALIGKMATTVQLLNKYFAYEAEIYKLLGELKEPDAQKETREGLGIGVVGFIEMSKEEQETEMSQLSKKVAELKEAKATLKKLME